MASPRSSLPRLSKKTLNLYEVEDALLGSDSEMDISDDEMSVEDWLSPSDSEGDDAELPEEEGDTANVQASGSQRDDVLTADEWDDGPIIFRSFSFNERPGLRIAVDDPSPYGVFRLLFSNMLLDIIMNETNRYAAQKIATGKAKSLSQTWTDVDLEDLFVFFALVFAMGIIRMPDLKSYWRTDSLFYHGFFPRFMKRDRFLNILNCLHFVDNETADKSVKTWKCQNIVDFFNDKMHELNVPVKQVSIDESMMLFRGRLRLRQYIKHKAHKYGVKFYMLCQANGMTHRIIVYGGAGTAVGPQGHATFVVNELMQNYKDKGYTLYMDNYYNSVTLSRDLLNQNTHTTGTIGKKRRGNCDEVVSQRLKKGEVFWRHNNGVVQMKWRDTRDVFMISTEHGPDKIITTNARGVEKQRPEMVEEYNKFMSGVDRVDQYLGYYDVLRKTRKWYRKVALRVIHIMLVNAMLIYNGLPGVQKMSTLKFQEEIIRNLLEESGRIMVDPEARAARGHFPVAFPDMPTGRKGRKLCRQCVKDKTNRRTSYFCSGCTVETPLCVACFKDYAHD